MNRMGIAVFAVVLFLAAAIYNLFDFWLHKPQVFECPDCREWFAYTVRGQRIAALEAHRLRDCTAVREVQ